MMSRPEKTDPWRVPIAVLQVPEGGLHRELDADAAVFPYLQLHAQRNGVHLATRHGTFADLTPQELVAPVYQLVCHRVTVGVAEILVADPGRPPFDALCAQYLH